MKQPTKRTKTTNYQWSCKERGRGKESLIPAMGSLSPEEGVNVMQNTPSPWGRQRGHMGNGSSRAPQPGCEPLGTCHPLPPCTSPGPPVHAMHFLMGLRVACGASYGYRTYSYPNVWDATLQTWSQEESGKIKKKKKETKKEEGNGKGIFDEKSFLFSLSPQILRTTLDISENMPKRKEEMLFTERLRFTSQL